MNMKNYTALLLIVLGLTTISCDNEIDLVAPYKEIGVVYGILNAKDSIQYVRIQKAFLGEGNANTMSQVPDSVYYPDILDVNLVRIKDGAELGSFPLTRFVGPDKEPGTFPTSPNILYKSNGEILFRDSEYRIVVTNTQTGTVLKAQTPVVDSIRIQRPTLTETIKFANPNPILVEFVPTPNGKVYNLTIRLKFLEEVVGSGVMEPKHIDWVFQNEVVANPENLSSIRKEIDGEDFYEFVDQKLQPKANTIRHTVRLDFIFTAGAEFLANYININQATSSILTTPPIYSNVEGGTGIFSSRFIQIAADKQLDGSALDLLKTGPLTGDLGFQ